MPDLSPGLPVRAPLPLNIIAYIQSAYAGAGGGGTAAPFFKLVTPVGELDMPSADFAPGCGWPFFESGEVL